MSSLGAKVKEILHSGDSQDAKRGEVDRNTPGSYPVEDTTTGHGGHEHNKLHKPNDPRGWTEDDKTPRGHAYKDSGVGLEESRGQSSYEPSRQTQQTQQTTFESEKPRDRLTESYERSPERPAESTTEPTASHDLGDSSRLTSQQDTTGSADDATSTSSKKHPYWGDLPSNGGSGGVHNTVIGHGSPEDEARRSSKQDTSSTSAAPLEGGSFSTRQDPSQPTNFSLPQRDTQQVPSSEAAAFSSSSQRDTQQVPPESTSGSRTKEGLAGAAGLGAVGAGAYALDKKHRPDETPERVEPAPAPAPAEATSSTQPEEHKGRSFPLLGHKDKHKEKEAHHTKEPKEDKKVIKEEKKAKEPKPEHESRFGALFHRGHKDKDEHKTETAPAPAQEDLTKEKEKEKEKDKHHRSKAGPALAAAGAGGAAAYAATRDRDDDRQTQTQTQRQQDNFNTTASRYQQDPTAPQPRGTDQYQSTSTSTGTGQYYGTGQHSGTTQQPVPVASQFSNAGQHSGLGGTSAAGFESQRAQPTDRSIHDSTTQSRQPESSHGHRDAKLATGAVAGLGAGALASHELGNRTRNDQPQSQSQPQSGYTTQDNSRQFQSQSRQPVTMASTHGHETSRNEPLSGSGLGSDKFAQDRSTETGTGELPTVTRLANEGKYNTLASGTPSGVRTDGFADNARLGQKQPVNVDAPSGKDKDRHYGAGVAGLGAAAGLGTAAALSRDKDDKDKKDIKEKEQPVASRTQPETERQVEHQTERKEPGTSHRSFGTGAGTGLTKPVIHKCQKCGEDNDISQYFTSNQSGGRS